MGIPASTRSALIESLMRGEAFPHAVGRIELVETHISWVILTGDYAYKIKKPVRLEFLDFSTLGLRKRYCEEELRLNRRLAPGIYECVIGIGGEPSRPRVGREPAFEYAVKMRQFPADAQLDRRLALGMLHTSDLRALGSRIGAFHMAAAAASADSRYGSASEVRSAADANLDALEALATDEAERNTLASLRRWTDARSSELSPVFLRRKAEGRVREGHGDLHLSNLVALDTGITAFDCIEFDDSLRWIDVISDIAFLVMDLELRGRADLAYAFLDGYLETTGDYSGVGVLRYYRVYRSLVRAKVAAVRRAQVTNLAAENRRRMAHLYLAERYTRPSRPRLVLMHGYSGSGKSWLGGQLAAMMPAMRIRSDVERKRLAGLEAPAASRSGVAAGLYAPGMTWRTYAQLESCVRAGLQAGESVLVDAAFLMREQRTCFLRLAHELRAPCTIIDCLAERSVLEERIRARDGDASEADAAVLAYQQRVAEPLGADEPVIAVRTDGAVALHALVQRIRSDA